MNEEQTTPRNDAPVVDMQQNEAPRPDPQSQDPRRRLRELLAIPERDRSDALWDEIIGLEIQLAPENRAQSPQADVGRRQEPSRAPQPGRRQDQGRRQESASRTRPGTRFFKGRKRGSGTPT